MKTLGLMSGTSADGIDIVLMDDNPLRLMAADFVPYSATLRNKVLAVIQGAQLTAVELTELDSALGDAYSQSIDQFLKKHHVAKDTISAIGLHGQTVAHLPESKPANTLQLGHPAWLAAQIDLPVVADFRTMDMAYSGQGAPLAPALHRHLFNHDEKTTGVLNLGGIANLTVLKANAVIGYDVGPANCLMDEWCALHQNCDYDQGGDWASKGQVNPQILIAMLNEGYFQQKPPKSTGRELFNQQWLRSHLKKNNVSAVDVQRTLLELVVQTVNNDIMKLAEDMDELIVVGGGVHNRFLMQKLEQAMSFRVSSSADYGINPDYVEALLMAWLAARHVQAKTTDMRSVTGCRIPLIYGQCFSPGSECV